MQSLATVSHDSISMTALPHHIGYLKWIDNRPIDTHDQSEI